VERTKWKGTRGEGSMKELSSRRLAHLMAGGVRVEV